MTKPALAAATTLATLLLLIACVPAAMAHGAPEGREIDTRVLEDDDGGLAPGGCSHDTEQACANPQNLGGLDLLALDVREMHTANGTPAASFRVLFQGGNAGVAQTVSISLTAGGAAQTLTFTGNTGGPYNSTTCSAFAGAVVPPGADDHVSAVDCIVTYAALGVNGTGDALTAISVLSSVGAKKYDAMPGTWYTNDGQSNLAPRVPVCDSSTTPPTCEQPQPSDATGGDLTPGAYTLAGPAKLVDATLSAATVDLRQGPAIVDIVLGTSLNGTTQVVTLNMSAPTSIQASLDAATAIVGNESRTVKLHLVGATKDGAVTVILTSDLGFYQVLSVAVTAPPPPPACPTGTAGAPVTATSVPTNCPTTDTDTKASGAPEMVFVAGLVCTLALTRRRAA